MTITEKVDILYRIAIGEKVSRSEKQAVKKKLKERLNGISIVGI